MSFARRIIEGVFWAVWLGLGLALLSVGAEAQVFVNDGMESVIRLSSASGPAFSFAAPTAGDYATLTAATGQTITCSRASTDTVRTGASTIVAVASGHCAVADLGVQYQEARTNSILQAQALDNAAWSKVSATVLADQCVFPDGTTSMDKVTSSGNIGQVFQLAASTATVTAVSGWAATLSGTQTISLGAERQGGTSTSSCTCTMPSGCAAVQSGTGNIDCLAEATIGTSPTRLGATLVTGASATGFYLEASPGPWGAAGNNGAIACFGGLQEELGARFPTSYIPTVGTAVTRAAEQDDVGAITLGTSVSITATVTLEGLPAATATALSPSDGTHAWVLAVDSSGHAKCTYAGNSDTSTATVTPGTAAKVGCIYDGATVKACVGGACHGTAAVFTPVTSFTHLYIGWDGTANWLNGWISTACAAKTSTGCAP